MSWDWFDNYFGVAATMYAQYKQSYQMLSLPTAGSMTLFPGVYHYHSGQGNPLYFCGDSQSDAANVTNGTYAGQAGSWYQIAKGQIFQLTVPLVIATNTSGPFAVLEMVSADDLAALQATASRDIILVSQSSRANPDGSYDLPLTVYGCIQELSLTVEDPATLIQTYESWPVAPQGLAGYISQPALATRANARLSARARARW